jgi:hypothetical protein
VNKDYIYNLYDKNLGNDTFISNRKESLEILLENMVLMGCNSTLIGIYMCLYIYIYIYICIYIYMCIYINI